MWECELVEISEVVNDDSLINLVLEGRIHDS